MTKTAKLSDDELNQFTGTATWFRHGISPAVLFTEGVKYVADEGGAYWLLDIIAIAQRSEKRVMAEVFQVWKLTVHVDRSARRLSAKTVITTLSKRRKSSSPISPATQSRSGSPIA